MTSASSTLAASQPTRSTPNESPSGPRAASATLADGDRHTPPRPPSAGDRARRAAHVAGIRAETARARRDAAAARQAELGDTYRPAAEQAAKRASVAAQLAKEAQARASEAHARTADAHEGAAQAHTRAADLACRHGDPLRTRWHRDATARSLRAAADARRLAHQDRPGPRVPPRKSGRSRNP